MITALPSGGFDDPQPGAKVPAGTCHLLGWALDHAAPFSSVFITLNRQIVATTATGLPRAEMAERYPRVPHAAHCGWEAVLDLRGYPPGPTALGVTGLTAAGDTIPLATVPVVLVGDKGAGSRPACVFTLVQNEPRYLPRWLAYYERHFDARDIYVLDHNTTDGSTSGLDGRCNVTPVYHEASYDSYWMKSMVESYQAFLLRSYNVVLFAEVDEFVMANPSRFEGLQQYIQAMPGVVARCAGYEVVQDPDEAALEFDRPLLAQRAYWYPSAEYSKPLLSKVPLTWDAGFHETRHPPGLNSAPDPDLVLAHLHRIDFAYCRLRHEEAASRPWKDEDIARGHGAQTRIFEPEAYRKWFYEEADRKNGPREKIPDPFRKVF